jgi:RNA polymerase sigma-70 factor (ECF subfamily)
VSGDLDVAARIRDGDEAACEALFLAVYAPLCRFANHIVAAPDIAEELVQDVFVKLWRNRASLEVHTSLRAYLYRAVRNSALNHVERRRTEQRWRDFAAGEAEDPPIGTTRLEAEQVAAELDRALSSLPPRCREVVELRWRHGLKHAEIAEALGISVKGVEIQLTRGLGVLRRVLGEGV